MEINKKQLKEVLGEDLYNVSDIKTEKVYADDVIYVIKQYMSNEITMEVLLDWVNIIWFTDLYEYNNFEEDTIATVMSLLEMLDEDGVEFVNDDFLQMIEMLKNNKAY